MVRKIIFAFLMSYATASLVTIAQMIYKNVNYDLMLSTYISAMKISWPVVFVCIILIAPFLQNISHKLVSLLKDN